MRQRHNKNMQAPGAKYSAKGKGPCSAIVATHSKHQASDSSAYLHCSGPAKLSRSPTAAAEALSFSRYGAVRNVTCSLQSKEQSPFCTLHLALQLLRIETEGAYAGLVAGSPIADDLDTASRSADIQPNASACTLCALAAHQSHQKTSRLMTRHQLTAPLPIHLFHNDVTSSSHYGLKVSQLVSCHAVCRPHHAHMRTQHVALPCIHPMSLYSVKANIACSFTHHAPY